MWREKISWIACKLKGNSLNTLSWLGFFERCSVFHCFCEIGAVWNCESGPTLVSAFSRWPCPGGGSRWVAWHHHEESQLWYSSGLVSNSIISCGPLTIKDQCKKCGFFYIHTIKVCVAYFRRCPETSPFSLTHLMILLYLWSSVSNITNALITTDSSCRSFCLFQKQILFLELAIWPFDLFTWSSLAGQVWWSLLKKGLVRNNISLKRIGV